LGQALLRAMAVAAVVAAMVEPPCRADSGEAARTAIRSALDEWRSAFNDRDERHVCDLFAADLIANYQGQPERDFASLCGLLQTSVRDPERTYHYSFDIGEIMVFDATAIVRLIWTLEIEKAGEPSAIVSEPAIDVFRRQNDGVWKISRYLAYPAVP
jgi:ketosteroid isomerase-like protein